MTKEKHTRLVIDSLVLENFKSYAGTISIGPFNKSFTSIVGPNGSGKSNVIDAILFVFGFRTQAIRQKKVSELIHNSDKYPNLTKCKVSILFKVICDDIPANDQAIDNVHEEMLEDQVIDQSMEHEFVVSREAFSNSTSHYYLDGKKVGKDVVISKLKSYDIDLDFNRFLILQGEVEMIATMKPKGKDEDDYGLLEYLEEIIGSSQYKRQIVEVKQQLDELNQARQERLNRHRLVIKDRDNLQAGRDKALAYIDINNEMVFKKKLIHNIHAKEAQDKVDAIKLAIEALEKTTKDLESKQSSMESQMSTAKEAYFAHQNKLKQVTFALEQAENEFSNLERKDAKFREDMKHLKSKQRARQLELTSEKDAVDKLELFLDKLKIEIAVDENKIEDLKSNQSDKERQLESLRDQFKREINEIQDKIQTIKRESSPFDVQLNDVQNKIAIKQTEMNYIDHNKTELDTQRETLANKHNQLNIKQQSILEEFNLLQHKLTTLTQELHDVNNADNNGLLINKNNQVDELKQALITKRSELYTLKEQYSKTRSSSNIYTKLTDLARSGKIPGIYGRLGSLGRIESKYDVAITSSVGALKNIVVDTVETAQACISYLRENNLGRATFIVLQQIQHLSEQLKRGYPAIASAERLIDCIVPNDPKFLVAFYSAMRDTLVCQDMDIAVKVANYNNIKRRVVTLQGNLIEATGAITGGGNEVRKGGMDLITKTNLNAPSTMYTSEVTQEEIIAREREIKELEENIKGINDDIILYTNRIHEIQIQIDNIELRLGRIDIEKTALPNQLSMLSSELNNVTQLIEQNQNASTAKIIELRDEIDVLNNEKDRITGHVLRFKKQINELETQKNLVGGNEMISLNKEVVSAINEVDTVLNAITKGKVHLKSNSKKLETSKVKIMETERVLHEITTSIDCLSKSLQDLVHEASEVEGAKDELIKHKAEKELLFKNELEPEYQQYILSIKRIKEQQLDLRNEMDTEINAYREHEGKLTQWVKGLESLKYIYLDIEEYDNKVLTEYQQQEDHELQTILSGAIVNSNREDSSAPTSVILKKRKDAINYDVGLLEEKIKSMRPNLNQVAEYDKKSNEAEKRGLELQEATVQRDEAKDLLETIKSKRLDCFICGFNIITMKLKEMYQMITLGGDAELELVDSLDPFSEGVVFSVRPPKKSWKTIQNLSGGEKTLSSLALVFALHHYKPTPIYVMDEIDAALDFKNVSIIANYIKSKTTARGAQFLIISLRNNMFELADTLIGIYKTDNHTKSVTLAIS